MYSGEVAKPSWNHLSLLVMWPCYSVPKANKWCYSLEHMIRFSWDVQPDRKVVPTTQCLCHKKYSEPEFERHNGNYMNDDTANSWVCMYDYIGEVQASRKVLFIYFSFFSVLCYEKSHVQWVWSPNVQKKHLGSVLRRRCHLLNKNSCWVGLRYCLGICIFNKCSQWLTQEVLVRF